MVMGVVSIFVMVSLWGIIGVLQQTFKVDSSKPIVPEPIKYRGRSIYWAIYCVRDICDSYDVKSQSAVYTYGIVFGRKCKQHGKQKPPQRSETNRSEQKRNLDAVVYEEVHQNRACQATEKNTKAKPLTLLWKRVRRMISNRSSHEWSVPKQTAKRNESFVRSWKCGTTRQSSKTENTA